MATAVVVVMAAMAAACRAITTTGMIMVATVVVTVVAMAVATVAMEVTEVMADMAVVATVAMVAAMDVSDTATGVVVMEADTGTIGMTGTGDIITEDGIPRKCRIGCFQLGFLILRIAFCAKNQYIYCSYILIILKPNVVKSSLDLTFAQNLLILLCRYERGSKFLKKGKEERVPNIVSLWHC
jgi:hypothetical protein